MKLETFCRKKPPEKANQQTHQFAEQGPSPDSGVPAGQHGWGGGGQGGLLTELYSSPLSRSG